MLRDSKVCIRFNKLINSKEKRAFGDRLSSRMVKCASVMQLNEHIGWQMIVPQKGKVDIRLFGSDSLSISDLEWIADKTATTNRTINISRLDGTFSSLYELYLPISDDTSSTVGFTACSEKTSEDFCKWPMAFSSQFAEFVEVLRQSGAQYRAVIGPADEEQRKLCRKNTLRNLDTGRIDATTYIGNPVKARFLLLLPSTPKVRLLSVLDESVPGIKTKYLGELENAEVRRIWDNPLESAKTLPDYAVRVMIMEPILEESIVGIEVCEEIMKPIPATHKNTKTKGAVVIGKAVDVTGVKHRITIGQLDFCRHYQIVGQTGCGKSTMLTSIILSAIKQGHGLTFFDPHGTTIDTIIRCVPKEYAHRINLVRIGDADNPVPLNIWDSGDPIKEERNISDLCELFSDIFDPHREGFVGPRYERWLSVFAKASLAFLGRRASLESIAVISQSKENMLKLAKSIYKDYPDLYETIKCEYGQDNSNEFNNTLNWYLCKFQRITAVEQLRKTLGAGANALNFNHSIDTNAINLIDLSSATIGTHAARIIGTLTLMKFWNAAITRKERDKTHILVLDEASLFQTNPLPRILAEGRKYGVACCLCHQHIAQLSPDIRDALEANSANLSVFRLSAKDATNAAIRFDNPDIISSLTRLNAFNAVTSLSVDGQQTAPFTLETIRPKKQPNSEELAAWIETESIKKLVEPYEDYKALTRQEIQQLLNKQQRASNNSTNNTPNCNDHQNTDTKSIESNKSASEKITDSPNGHNNSLFVRNWNEYKKKNLKVG